MKEPLSEKKNLFVGLNTIDLQFRVNQYPKPNTKTKTRHHEICVGGPATNAGIACAHLGSCVDIFTPIGRHTLSDFIKDDIAKYDIKIIDPIANSEGKPVFASIITSSDNGDRTILSYHPDNVIEYEDNLNFNIKDYTLVMFDGFHPELAVPIARECRKEGVHTVLDGGSWKSGLAELLYYMDVVICSQDFSVPSIAGTDDTYKYLHQKGVHYVAITRGEKSILYSHSKGKGEIPTKNINAMDTLGAGDFFHGAFCHYFSIKNDFIAALHEACNIAAKSCLSYGTRAWMKDTIINS